MSQFDQGSSGETFKFGHKNENEIDGDSLEGDQLEAQDPLFGPNPSLHTKDTHTQDSDKSTWGAPDIRYFFAKCMIDDIKRRVCKICR